jgi:hypothetical protein
MIMSRAVRDHAEDWNNLPKAEVPDMHALPSMEHVLYLFNIANFHLCPGVDMEFFSHHDNESGSERPC